MTGAAIRLTAVSAATSGGSPNRRTRKSVCSPMTMASSTTIPSVRISAKSEIMLKVSPKACIIATAASMATGMPAATQKAVRAFRNRKRIAITRPRPIAPFWIRISSRARMSSDRTRIMSIVTPAGSV